jgi:hypothetical protein
MLVIFGASTDLGSAAHTSRFLVPFLFWINPHVSFETIVAVQFAVRKAAHVTEYAVLALLLLRAIRNRTRNAFTREAVIVLLGAALYAATDEFHQSFVSSRTASPIDVMIDWCGAALGVAAYSLFKLRSAGSQTLATQTAR